MTAADAPHQTYWANEARKAIAEARTTLCPCGVERGKCAGHRETTEETSNGR